MRRWYDRWGATVAFALVAIVAWLSWGRPAVATVITVLCIAGAVWWSPLRPGHHVDQAEAARTGGVVVYWKPGCVFCARLRRDLTGEQRDQVTWVNIWRDDAAAEYVAGLNDGDELTPTVVADGERIDADAAAIDAHAR